LTHLLMRYAASDGGLLLLAAQWRFKRWRCDLFFANWRTFTHGIYPVYLEVRG